MSRANDGGPAFPSGAMPANASTSRALHQGISLRDYFAAAAMSGLLSRDGSGEDIETLAVDAYWAADRMLAQREKPPEESS